MSSTAAPAAISIPQSLAECRVEVLADDTRLVLAPEPDRDGREVRLASWRWDAAEHWWRGFWSEQWHFCAHEQDVRDALDADLRAGFVTV
ncbi:MAG: hypothetical protein F4118_11220 [Acidimicrobiaceae bacterium]|nr:hypothetical protein [Acidimicrobiaceae bacterium]MYI36977.1 hypothetical protein [Acidimicrobiaceae bacterium]